MSVFSRMSNIVRSTIRICNANLFLTSHNTISNARPVMLLQVPKKFLSTQAKRLLYNKHGQYEYDPKTDSFRPKSDTGFTSNQDSKNWKVYLSKFLRNLLLITGGVVWTGVIFVSLFVDVKESDIKPNLEEHLRFLIFYDLMKNKKDISNMLENRDRVLQVAMEVSNSKETAFTDALDLIRNSSTLIEKIGKPIQLCGYVVVPKLYNMVENMKNDFTENSAISEDLSKYFDSGSDKQWTTVCVLEGPKGLALYTAKFRFSKSENMWKLFYNQVDLLGENEAEPLLLEHK